MYEAELYFDKVIIGKSIVALAHSYYEGVPVICLDHEHPPYWHKIGEKTKEGLWQEFSMRLSLAGLMPFADKAKNVKIEESKIEVYGKKPYVIAVHAEEILDLREQEDVCFEKEDCVYEVSDWFRVRCCMRHDHDFLYSDDDFVREVKFFQKPDTKDSQGFKDLVSISYMTKEQLLDPDYSETYVYLKTKKMMKDAGIRGSKNGVHKGVQKYLSLKIEHEHRDVFPVESLEEEVLRKFAGQKVGHPELKKLEGIFGELKHD